MCYIGTKGRKSKVRAQISTISYVGFPWVDPQRFPQLFHCFVLSTKGQKDCSLWPHLTIQ